MITDKYDVILNKKLILKINKIKKQLCPKISKTVPDRLQYISKRYLIAIGHFVKQNIMNNE